MGYTGEEIRRHIDEYARLTALAEEIARRIDDEKAYFTKLAERDLSDSKIKTMRYYGETARVTATTACTVKISKETALTRLFGAAYNDYVKTEVKTDIKGADAKRMLAAVFFDDVIETTPEECIRQMTADEAQRKLLIKKIKGKNPAKDADEIQRITGCSEKDAIYYASVFAEVTAYQEFIKLVKLSGVADEKTARELIHQGITVEKTAKIGIECKPQE